MTAISRRIAALVVAALLAILTAGLPAAPAAATAVEVVNLGITSYRPQPDGPDDPAFQRLRRVDDYYATPRYQAFERDLVAQAEAAGLEIVSLERATGVFEGAFERPPRWTCAAIPTRSRPSPWTWAASTSRGRC